MTSPTKPRWGIKYTSDPHKNREYLQTSAAQDLTIGYPGELYLNESLQQLYYIDSYNRTAKTINALPNLYFSPTDYSESFIELDGFDYDTFVIQINKETSISCINGITGKEYKFIIKNPESFFWTFESPLFSLIGNSQTPIAAYKFIFVNNQFISYE